MKLTLPNGVVLDGSEREVNETAIRLGYGAVATTYRDPTIWHYSQTKNTWTRIVDMDVRWLKNSILKILREWMEKVENAATPGDMVMLIKTNNDIHLAALMKALTAFRKW